MGFGAMYLGAAAIMGVGLLVTVMRWSALSGRDHPAAAT
jgi:hypothetical protein